jgi:hypothetical protein
MSLLGNLDIAADAAGDVDSLGGNSLWESGLYNLDVTLAYVQKSSGGATGVTLHLTDEDSGKELRETLWISSGDKKGNKTYYETQKGEKKNLPGFNLFRSLTMMTLNKEPSAIVTEEKVIKLYSYEAKAEVPTTVSAIVELMGSKIIGGVRKVSENKQVKNDAGIYVNDSSGATREKNELDKFFHSGTRMTIAEATGGLTEGEFIDQWEAKWKGVTLDKVEAVTPGATNAGVAAFGGGNAQAATPKPTASLFGAQA